MVADQHILRRLAHLATFECLRAKSTREWIFVCPTVCPNHSLVLQVEVGAMKAM